MQSFSSEQPGVAGSLSGASRGVPPSYHSYPSRSPAPSNSQLRTRTVYPTRAQSIISDTTNNIGAAVGSITSNRRSDVGITAGSLSGTTQAVPPSYNSYTSWSPAPSNSQLRTPTVYTTRAQSIITDTTDHIGAAEGSITSNIYSDVGTVVSDPAHMEADQEHGSAGVIQVHYMDKSVLTSNYSHLQELERAARRLYFIDDCTSISVSVNIPTGIGCLVDYSAYRLRCNS